VAWVSLLVIAVVPLVLGELALGPMRSAERIEARRVASAIRTGLVLAFAAVYVSLFTYAAGELDTKIDYSYFRTARASESTRRIATQLAEPVSVKAFFPQLNEVGVEVLGYLRDATRGATNLRVEEYDRLVVPNIAKDAKVTTDGVVVLTRGTSREALNVGVEMKSATSKLKSLDADFQKALLRVLRKDRVAYLTVGHGEINENRSDPVEGRSAKGLRKLFESQSYTVKDLGLTQGLGSEVPSDATTVVVLGPIQPFLPEEVDALRRFAERGGHLLLGLDPDAKLDLSSLAEIVGLSYSPVHIVQETALVRRRYNKSDRAIVVTNRFSSHASVSTLSRSASRVAVIFPGASSLDKKPGAGDFKIDFAIKSLPGVFADANDNLERDPNEKRGVVNLAAAVTRPVPRAPEHTGTDSPELRAFVMADADALSDAAFSLEPNVLLAADVIRWLGGEESFSGAIASTEDVRIDHTRQKDAAWFYATILGAPGLVLGLGLLATRRRKPKRGVRAPSRLPEEKSS
jgi:hypothetical protein